MFKDILKAELERTTERLHKRSIECQYGVDRKMCRTIAIAMLRYDFGKFLKEQKQAR